MERGQHVVFNIDQIVVIVCEMHTNVYMMKVRREYIFVAFTTLEIEGNLFDLLWVVFFDSRDLHN